MNKSTWIYIAAPFVLLVVVLIPIIVFGNKCSPQIEEEKAEKVKKKLSGKQCARRIALIMMILAIISGIAENLTMLDLLFRVVASYCLVMFVGYPIVQRIARRDKKAKDEQKQ